MGHQGSSCKGIEWHMPRLGKMRESSEWGISILARPVTGFPTSLRSLFPRLGDGSLFSYWPDDLLNGETLHEEFPILFALARVHEAMVRECCDDMWYPIMQGVLSYQMVEDLLGMLTSMLHLKPMNRTQDGWEWEGISFSIQGVYMKIRD